MDDQARTEIALGKERTLLYEENERLMLLLLPHRHANRLLLCVNKCLKACHAYKKP
jgi:hypothetical protein